MSARRGLVLVLVLAGALYLWNAAAQQAFWGFDEGGHAGYALSIRLHGYLPDPYSGWSTFHPPLAHLIDAGAWALLELSDRIAWTVYGKDSFRAELSAAETARRWITPLPPFHEHPEIRQRLFAQAAE